MSLAQSSNLGLAKAQYSGSLAAAAVGPWLLFPDADSAAVATQALPGLGSPRGLLVAVLPLVPGTPPTGVAAGQQNPATEVTLNSLFIQVLGLVGVNAGTVLTATLYVQRQTATSNAPNPTSYAAPVLAPVSTGLSVSLTLAATATVQQAWSPVNTQALSPTPPSGAPTPVQVQPGDTYFCVLTSTAAIGTGGLSVQVAVA